MATYYWPDVPDDLLKAGDVLWGLRDSERLSGDAPEEVADDVLSGTDNPLPADWTCEVHAWRRKKVDPDFADGVAESMLERYREAWAEEYGDPDGDAMSDDNGEDDAATEALRAWVRGRFTRSVPWECEKTGDVIVFDVEWARRVRAGVVVGAGTP